ncbi:hypothetical protein B9Z55_021147 [Caenorhabditis nigoni]|uniref:Lin-15A/B-like domain-containing protein n=1 Tax=Caenorhabditis nigoni TaxID=1611254 RepID=A0A2G5TQP7_9PELO|nr:hypothetical protein B9Z55_021147 [Caenorhabditis nigoni]
MSEPIFEYEVTEEENNFTFINGEFVEVKQEEIEEKPEYLLEQDIKKETNDDFFENNEADDKISEVVPEVSMMKCEICQKSTPRSLLRLVKSEDDKTVLSDYFEVEGSLEAIPPYVCVSHIQKIIDDNDGKVKRSSTPSEKRLRLFITKNKRMMKVNNKFRRRACQFCHEFKECYLLYRIYSKHIRIVLMVGFVLRGTHSIDQAKSYITNNRGETCHSHCKESIDMVFEHLGVRNIEEFSKCSTLMMKTLMDIAKKIDSNFTAVQFIEAFKWLFMKHLKFPSSL